MRESIATRLFACFNARDADSLGEILDENVTHTAPGPDFGAHLQGRNCVVSYFRDKVFARFEKIEFVAERSYFDVVANVELTEWHGRMRTNGGVEYANRGIFVLELAGGRLKHMREYFDTAASRQAHAQGSAGNEG